MALMMKNQILIIGFLTILHGTAFTQTPGSKPRIVFVFVDDWGYADVGSETLLLSYPTLICWRAQDYYWTGIMSTGGTLPQELPCSQAGGLTTSTSGMLILQRPHLASTSTLPLKLK